VTARQPLVQTKKLSPAKAAALTGHDGQMVRDRTVIHGAQSTRILCLNANEVFVQVTRRPQSMLEARDLPHSNLSRHLQAHLDKVVEVGKISRASGRVSTGNKPCHNSPNCDTFPELLDLRRCSVWISIVVTQVDHRFNKL